MQLRKIAQYVFPSFIHAFFVVFTRRVKMMHNPKQLFLFHFLTFVHSVNAIFILFMTKEGLKRKGTMGCPVFRFLWSWFSVKMVGYYRKGTLIRKDMIEFLRGSSFLECTAFFLNWKQILIWLKDVVSQGC